MNQSSQEAFSTKQLPNAPDAERSILCCILHNPDRFLIRASSDNITPEFFYNATNQRIFQIIHEQHQQGKNIDVTSVSEMIRDRKEANLSVADLGDIMLSEHSENSWQDYAEILRDRYARRLAIEAGQQVASQNLSGESAVFALKQAAEAAMNALVGSTAIQRAGDAVGAFLAKFKENYENGRIPGLSTGFSKLDEKTGGMRKGEFWVIGAKTSVGKSVMMLQIAQHAIRDGKKVAIFTLEMGADEVVGRMIACGNSIPIGEITQPRHVSKINIDKIRNAAKSLADTGLMICDNADLSIDAISGHCQRIQETTGLDLVVIDYLQLISTPKNRGQSREQEVAQISRACKQLAKRLKCPVLTATQLNEAGQSRESRAIEHDADCVFFIMQSEHECQLNIWKARNSKRGECLPVLMRGEYQRFEML
jgi:replicative DNA helicase